MKLFIYSTSMSHQKMKIVVAGDSGVGKTALVNLLCYNKVLTNPNWTIGAQVEIKLHDYQAGTPSQESYFLEFWDIGGYKIHTNSRSVFYSNTDGLILVYDITNKKSENNLEEWIDEISKCNIELRKDLYQEDSSILKSYLGDSFGTFSSSSEWFRKPSVVSNFPILVVGTNLDQFPISKSLQIIEQRRGYFAQNRQLEEIILSNMSSDSLAPGCSNSLIMDRFFDQVISNKINTNLRTNNIDIGYSTKHVLIRMEAE